MLVPAPGAECNCFCEALFPSPVCCKSASQPAGAAYSNMCEARCCGYSEQDCTSGACG